MKIQRKEQAGKVYCRYCIIDLDTGYTLICGEKWKDYYLLHMFNVFECSFRSGFGFRRIVEYSREIKVKGRRCVIVYWANAPIRKNGCVVTVSGCIAGLKGDFYDRQGKAWHLRSFLCKSLRYKRIKKNDKV